MTTPRDGNATRTGLRRTSACGGGAIRLLLILAGIGVAAGLVPVLVPALARSGVEETAPATPIAQPTSIVAGAPIASEALVFRSATAPVANDPAAPRRSGAHPRDLTTFRSVRAYPGAPPRVPHGLTDEEFREGRCNNCHQRGGWVARFAAYAPLAPHPDMGGCLQCHATDAAVVGVPLPARDDLVCGQCHRPAAAVVPFVGSDWRPAAWPTLATAAATAAGADPAAEVPPPIPHALDSRGYCQACHAGPGAVEEIRTTHPERADCRQCHVQVSEDEEVFVRPIGPQAAMRTTEGTP